MIDHLLETQRQRYLEMLYELDGRDQRDHPLHSLYTGLFDQRRESLMAADMKLLLSGNAFI